MNISGLFQNITNPALLFFLLGILALKFKSELSIPKSSGKFIAVYLLLAIGFKGGQELSHTPFNNEILMSIVLGLTLSAGVPLLLFFILKRKFSSQNAGAVAAAYGSVSAVTFVTTIAFLESKGIGFGGHMVATMAIMEAPAIIVGVLLAKMYSGKREEGNASASSILRESLTNESVFLIIGSLIIGFLATPEQAREIRPFTTDIFKGFLAVFLLDMGLTCGRQLSMLNGKGIFPFAFAAIIPFFNGFLALALASLITSEPGNLLLFALLGAGASYIAVPAAMKVALPNSSPSLYLSMALGITFPINVMLGIPIYYAFVEMIV